MKGRPTRGTTVVEDDAAGDARAVAGTRIGRYTIARQLGAGGMGVVFEAHDPQLDRRVALKLVGPRSRSASNASVLRFKREAQAMAKLAHPNVVPVYDVGEHDERVFIAMDLVDGWTFGAWRVEHRPDWRATLAMLRQAGLGLAAAHTAGLIHRDFKPDNLMVGRDGRLRVMDFGLARALDTTDSEPTAPQSVGSGDVLSSPLTHTGAVLGTPAYMAPEQFRGAAPDASSDLFSFCVTAYEALYGARPFDGESQAAVFLNVSEGNIIVPPSTSPVPVAVWDALRPGLSADPSQRPRSVRQLLASLDDAAARSGRRVWWAMGIASLVIVTGLSVGSTARDEASRAPTNDDNEALAASHDEAAEPLAARLTTAREQLDLGNIERAVELAQAVHDAAAQSGATAAQAEALAIVGRAQARRSGDQRIADTLHAAVDLAAAAQSSRATIDASFGLASLACTTGDIDDARRWARLAAATLQRTGQSHLSGQQQWLDAHVDEAAGDWPSAVEGYRQALRTLARREEAAAATARVLDDLAYALARTERSAHAVVLSERAVASWRALVGSDHIRYAQSLRVQAGVLRLAERHEDAAASLRDARAIFERTLADDDLRWVSLLAEQGNLADVMRRGDQALALHRRRLELLRHHRGNEAPAVGAALLSLGATEHRGGALAQGLATTRDGTRILEAAWGPNHPQLAKAHNNIGTMLQIAHDYEGAQQGFARAIAVAEHNFGPLHHSLSGPLVGQGSVLMFMGHAAEALPLYERAVAVLDANDATGIESAYARLGLLQALSWLDRLDEAHAIADTIEPELRRAGPAGEALLEKLQLWRKAMANEGPPE